MSSVIHTPPREIVIGGRLHGQPAPVGGGEAADQGGKGDPRQVVALAKRALLLVQQVATMEGDDADAAVWHKIGAQIAAQIGNEQRLVDKAMGAGPGVKLVRKSVGGRY